MMPLISVVMPAYNSEKYISEAIESILNQTYKNFEFIIVDDGSRDNTVKIVDKYANMDARIIFLANANNMGISYTLNKGINIAKGKYISRMDADDISYPDRFQKQFDFMENNKEIGVLGTYIIRFNEMYGDLGVVKRPTEDRDIRLFAVSGCPFSHPSVMIRKSVLNNHKLRYDAKFDSAEDYEFWHRLKKYTKLHILPETLLRYRLHEKSISRKLNVLQIQTTFKIFNIALKELVKEDFYIPIYEDPKDLAIYALRESFRVLSEIPLMLLKDDCPFSRSELVWATMKQKEYILDSIELP